MARGCAAVLLKAQGGMLCPPQVETGPFEPCGLYRLIVRLWLRPSPVMSQHSRERINELVLGQMSSIVNAAASSGSKGTRSLQHCNCENTHQNTYAPPPSPRFTQFVVKYDNSYEAQPSDPNRYISIRWRRYFQISGFSVCQSTILLLLYKSTQQRHVHGLMWLQVFIGWLVF